MKKKLPPFLELAVVAILPTLAVLQATANPPHDADMVKLVVFGILRIVVVFVLMLAGVARLWALCNKSEKNNEEKENWI